MDPSDFNRKVWEATIAAQFQLAGVRGFDPKTQAFLIPSGSAQNGFPGLTTQTTAELQNFNAQLYNLADQMPLASDVQWSPASNRRYNNYGVYLDYADPGAHGNGAYAVAYQVAQQNYNNELPNWTPIKKAAQTAYQAANSTKPFKDWVQNDYLNSDEYLNEQAIIGRLQSALNTASSNYYGPLWSTLETFQQNWNIGQQAYMSADTLGYNMDCGAAGVNPAYNMDRNSWATTYLGWISQATKNPPPPPSATATVTITSDSETNLTDYGLTTTHAQTSTFSDFPFIFWGEGDYTSTTEREEMYQKQTFNSATITMTSLVQPVSFPITPGKWYSTNLTTVFQNLLAGAPKSPGALVYPYAATVVLAYNVGFKVSLESSVYESLKSTVTTTTSSKAVVGFLGWIFAEHETSGSYNDREISSFSKISFDDATNTVTINPDNNGIPTVLGVIVGKDPNVAQAPALQSTLVPAAEVQSSPIQTGPAQKPQEAALTLLSATKSFILDFKSFFSSLSRQQRATVANAIKKVLRPSARDFEPLIHAIDDIASSGRFNDDEETNEIVVEQFFRHSALSITVKNTSGGYSGGGGGYDAPVLKFSDEVLTLAGLFRSQSSLGKASPYVSIASSLILRALAALAGIKAPGKITEKAGLVSGFVQELISLGVSSDIDAQDDSPDDNQNEGQDDTQDTSQSVVPAADPTFNVQGKPYYFAQGNIIPVLGDANAATNGAAWAGIYNRPGVIVTAGTAYRIDLVGFRQGCTATATVGIRRDDGSTQLFPNLVTAWNANDLIQFLTFTPANNEAGLMYVYFNYTDPGSALNAPLPLLLVPSNPIIWKLRYD